MSMNSYGIVKIPDHPVAYSKINSNILDYIRISK